MQSRRDLFHAHRLMTQRASLALLSGQPDVPDQPLRRLNVAAFSSLLVAVIAAVLFFIVGLLGHGGSALQDQGGTLAIDKQTGQPYVFCKNGKDLCPVVNYASARLALQSLPADQVTVNQAALAKFPRGPEIGIPGLPPLPEPSLLVKQPWSVCTQTSVVGVQTVTLSGGIQTGGTALGSGGALLAQVQGQDWVIWNAQRFPVQPRVLGDLTSTPPAAVAPAWLDALPQGPAFAAPPIAGRGKTVTGPTGALVTVGQVYKVSTAGGTEYYVMLSNGLARISQTQASLLGFEPGAPPLATLGASQVTGHVSASAVPGGGLPGSVPAFSAPSTSAPLCVVYAGGSGTLTAQVETGGQLPSGGAPTGFPAGADQVALPPGAGALVGDAPGPGQDSGAISYFLVTGDRRYALASKEVASLLGYSSLPSQSVLLPAGVIDLIPLGPALDPAQAAKTVPPGG